MASGGVLRVVGAAERKKHDKNAGDSRILVTMVRVGCAAGVNGPVVFLAKGEVMSCKALEDRNLVEGYGLPEGSSVIMTESGYMTEESWKTTVKALAPALRKMPVSFVCSFYFTVEFILTLSLLLSHLQVVRDHPDWPVVLTMDGFGAHVRVGEALEEFKLNNVWAVKEEADTSHVNQSYDNQVALNDKRDQKRILSRVRSSLKKVMHQYHLIAAMAAAIKNQDGGVWNTSFKAVNLHPHHRVPLDSWLEKIQNHITTGNEAFCPDMFTPYDAMPSVWKRLPVPA